jgi:hypothetical protein
MSATEFNITISNKIIKINKILIDNQYTNEYEFNMDYQYIQYYGKSFLKDLKINKFQDYIRFYEQKGEFILTEIDNDYYLELPIPFTDRYECIILKKPELTEIDELKILIKQQQDEFNKQLKDQENIFKSYIQQKQNEFKIEIVELLLKNEQEQEEDEQEQEQEEYE